MSTDVLDAAAPTSLPVDVIDKARVALAKAVLAMNEGDGIRLNKVCPSSVAVAVRILQHFGVPFVVECGYMLLQDVEEAIPHAWLRTPGLPTSGITDLAFTDNALRAFPVLGRLVFLADGAVAPKYSEGAALPTGYTRIYPGAKSVQELASYVGDIGRYLLGASQGMNDEVKRVVRSAVTQPAAAPPQPPPGALAAEDIPPGVRVE